MEGSFRTARDLQTFQNIKQILIKVLKFWVKFEFQLIQITIEKLKIKRKAQLNQNKDTDQTLITQRYLNLTRSILYFFWKLFKIWLFQLCFANFDRT